MFVSLFFSGSLRFPGIDQKTQSIDNYEITIAPSAPSSIKFYEVTLLRNNRNSFSAHFLSRQIVLPMILFKEPCTIQIRLFDVCGRNVSHVFNITKKTDRK